MYPRQISNKRKNKDTYRKKKEKNHSNIIGRKDK